MASLHLSLVDERVQNDLNVVDLELLLADAQLRDEGEDLLGGGGGGVAGGQRAGGGGGLTGLVKTTAKKS